MSLSKLIITHFKSYNKIKFDFHPDIQCLTGKNGVGKTNILDAIYLLCLGKSHFHSRDHNMIKWEEDFYRLEGHFGINQVAVTYDQTRGKKITYNKKVYDRIVDHLGKNTIIFIGPDDIELVNGVSLFRRRWMDVALCQVDSQYVDELSTYTRLLRQRNAYLKNSGINHYDAALIQSYNSKMIPAGKEVYLKRRQFIKELEKYVEELYFSISGKHENVTLTYTSDLFDNDFQEILDQNLQKDLILRRTTKGPHRDDFEIKLSGQKAKNYASQGQKKSLLFSVILALSKWLFYEKAKEPILILDDVFDKLDLERSFNLLELVVNGNFQQIFLSDAHPTRLKQFLESLGLPFGYLHLKDQQIDDEEAE